MKLWLKAGLAGMFASTVAFSAAAEQYTVGNWMAPTHPLSVGGFDAWAARVAEQSGGDITFELFHGGALYPAASALTATRDGLNHMGYVVANYTPSELPATASVGDIGFAHPDQFVLVAAMADFLINDDQIRSEWIGNGVLATSSYSTPEYIFICKEPVKTMADFAGKRIRTPNSGYGRLVTAFGAAPVSMPSAEIFTAFDRGALDCTVGDPTFMTSGSQILEVVGSVTMLMMTPNYTGALHAWDLDFWRGLTDDQRRLLLDNEAYAVAAGTVRYAADQVEAVRIANEKLEVIQPGDDMKAALAKFVTDNQTAMVEAAKALNVANPEDLMKRFDAYAVKWEGLMAGLSDRTDVEAFTALLKENIYDKVDVSTFGMN